MGVKLINFYKKKIKKEYKIAFFVTFLITLIIHFYKFTNNLPILDSLYYHHHNMDVTQSGRWALSLACSVSSYFDLPWIIGVLSCIYISLTVVVIVALFKIKNPIAIGLIGGIIAAAPATTDTFQYLYTADGYMLAMFLAALAVYLSRIEENRLSYKLIACFLICISCGIYQAYVNFALILVLCETIYILIENKHQKKKCLTWIFQQILIYLFALISYYIIWKLALKFTNSQAYDYLGIDEVGSFGMEHIRHGIIYIFETFKNYFFLWDIKDIGLVPYNTYNILFIASLLMTLIVIAYKKKIYKKNWAISLYILAIILIIPCSSFWYFTSLELYPANYMPKMLHCYTVLYIFTIILIEKYSSKIVKNIIAIFMTFIIVYNSIMSNISYFFMERVYKKSYANAVQLMVKINEVVDDEQNINEIVFLGSNNFKYNYYYKDFDNNMDVFAKYNVLMMPMYRELTFDGIHTYLFLKNYLNIPYNMSWDSDYRNTFFENPIVQEMNIWPKDNSIAIIDNTIIVKLSNDAEKENE